MVIKDFLLVQAHAALSYREVQQYLEHSHAPLALATPALAREAQRYTMNHLSEGEASPFQIFPNLPRLAVVVEHMFGGWEGIARFSADNDYIAKVRPDEKYMVERLMEGAPQFVAVDAEKPVFSGGDPTNLRMFDFIRRSPGLSREQFLAELDREGAWATADEEYRKAVVRRVHSIAGDGTASFGSDAEPFDAVIENWVTDCDRLAQLSALLRKRRESFCDAKRSFSAVTKESWISGETDAFGPRDRRLDVMRAQ